MAEANCNFCTFSGPTWSNPSKTPSPLRPGRGVREKMKQAILKTTEPRPKSNQTLFIKMLIFTCSRLSQRQLLFMRLHAFELARLRCGSPRDSCCGDEWRAFVQLAQHRERGLKVHYALRKMVQGAALINSSPQCFHAVWDKLSPMNFRLSVIHAVASADSVLLSHYEGVSELRG